MRSYMKETADMETDIIEEQRNASHEINILWLALENGGEYSKSSYSELGRRNERWSKRFT